MDLMCQTAFDFHQRIPMKVSMRLGARYLHSGVFFKRLWEPQTQKTRGGKISGQDANLGQLSQSFEKLNC